MRWSILFLLLLLVCTASIALGQNTKLYFPKGLTVPVDHIVFQPNGNLLAAGTGTDGEVVLWDATTGREVNRLSVLDAAHISFSPNGKYLAVCGSSGIRLWEIGTEVFKSLEDERGWMYSLAFTSDSRFLATGLDPAGQTWKHKIQIRDLSTGKIVRSVSGKIHAVCRIAFSPNDSLMATSGGNSDSSIIEVWNPWNGSLVNTLSTGDQFAPLLFSRDGKYLISENPDGRLNFFEMPNGVSTLSLDPVGIPVTFTDEGQLVAIRHRNTIVYYSLGEMQILRRQHFDGDVIFGGNRNRKLLATAMAHGGIALIDGDTGDTLCTLGAPCRVCGTPNTVKSILMETNGNHLAIQTSDTSYFLWSLVSSSTERISQLSDNWQSVGEHPSELQRKLMLMFADEDEVFDHVSFSPDSLLIAFTSDRSSDITIHDASAESSLITIPSSSYFPAMHSFSADGRYLFAEQGIGVSITNVKRGILMATLVLLGDSDWVVVTPDGLYDGTPEGIKFPHWVKDNKPILLENYSKGEYRPGLLRELLH